MMNKKTKRVNIHSHPDLADFLKEGGGEVHFIGIGGVSMYSLARLTAALGIRVTGSDREESDRTRDLSLLGISVCIGHFAETVRSASLVVYSHAISEDNPELLEARRLNIPTVSRAEYLGAVMRGYRRRIGISGSHGKSSTTAMLDCILSHAGANPTTLSGADLTIGDPLRMGGVGLMIYEACEYRDSFLHFSPTVALGLNIELDHTDYFEDIDSLKASFASALGRATDFAVINGDDQNLREIKQMLPCRTVSFGSGEHNDYQYSITSFLEVGFRFTLSRLGSEIGSFEMSVPGVYNVQNATAAIVTALEYGIDVDTVATAIASYGGISRRLELIGNRFGRPIYYDYAHHPTEIAAAINALKSLTRRPITVVFRPHTYSRTKALWRDFVASLSLADHIILCDIFAAREQPVDGVTSQNLAKAIGVKATYCSEEKIIKHIDLHTDGTIVLMGAGDLERVKKELI